MSIGSMQTREQFDLESIQRAVAEQGIDGWLLYYFHSNDDIALRVLHLSSAHFFSRRWFYFIPAHGPAIKLVHRIEMSALDSLPGERRVFLGWREMESQLAAIVQPGMRLAMQYSPGNAVPYVSRVDAGTVELIRSLGAHVESSANLVQLFESRWTTAQLATHLEAVTALREIVFLAFDQVRMKITAQADINEYELQQFILAQYEKHGMHSNSPPIVAVNANSGNPHYQPTASNHAAIKKDDFLLLDIWAKMKQDEAVYADITWTGHVAKQVPDKQAEIFSIVSGARDAAVEFIQDSVSKQKTIRGCDVDDVARGFIAERGYGDRFLHRTGHSIGKEVHGNGANIDNLETRDDRALLAGTAFSIEPGIYLPEFGVRSEIDVYLGEQEVIIGGQPIQQAVVPIMSL